MQKTFSGIKVKNKESQKRLAGFNKGPFYDYSQSNRIKLAAKIGFSFGLVVLFFMAFYQVSKFYDAHRVIFQTPIVFQKPIIIEDRVPVDEPEASPSAMIIETAHFVAQGTPKVEQAYAVENDDIDASVFFDIIWKNESSKGTPSKDPTALHMYCRAKGMFNEIGYNPQGKHCFKDKKEAELFIAYYIKKNCSEKTMAQCLCLYNTGKASNSCYYSEGNLSAAN